MTKINKQQADDIERAVHELCGSLPPNGLIFDGKWSNSWGKEKKYRFCGEINKKCGTFWDWSDNIPNTFFYQSGTTGDFKVTTPPKKIESNIEKEFKALSNENVNTHPYILKKKITLKNCRLKENNKSNPIYNDESKTVGWNANNNLLVIPIYNDESQLISWQTIDNEGKKLFKKGEQLTPGHYFPIGKMNEKVYIAEGVATGATINKITKELTLCSFSKGNLDNLAKLALKKFPKSKVIMCLDNDGDKTHETEIKNNRLITICPKKPGDFNDHPDKMKLLLVENYITPLNVKIRPVEYIDNPYGLLLKRNLTVISGAKTAMKSTGLLNYLFNFKLKIGYFSDWEVSEETLMKRAKATHSQNKIMRIHLEDKGTWDNIGNVIEAGELDVIIEDPPAEDKGFEKIVGVRKLLQKRIEICQKYNVAWLLVRNYSKLSDNDSLKKVSGFAVWTNMPRSTIIFYPLEEGHNLRQVKTTDEHNDPIPEKLQKAPKVSLMHSVVCNEGPLPDHSILLTLQTTQIEEDIKKASIDVPFCNIRAVERPKNAEEWVKAPDINKRDKMDTKLWKVVSMIQEAGKGGIKSYDLRKSMIDKLEISQSTAVTIIRTLKAQKYIYGGGKGNNHIPLKLTKTGIEYLEYD